MKNSKVTVRTTAKLLAGLLAGSFACSTAWAQADARDAAAQPSTQSSVLAAKLGPAQPASPRDWALRQGQYVKRNWGVEIVGIKPVSSGQMLAFRYKILDAEKAKLLNDRKSKAYVIDEATGIRLAVPAMEKVGELRQGSTPEEGRIYFMVFGNPGKVVKSGSRVSVVIGNFRIDGLVVS